MKFLKHVGLVGQKLYFWGVIIVFGRVIWTRTSIHNFRWKRKMSKWHRTQEFCHLQRFFSIFDSSN